MSCTLAADSPAPEASATRQIRRRAARNFAMVENSSMSAASATLIFGSASPGRDTGVLGCAQISNQRCQHACKLLGFAGAGDVIDDAIGGHRLHARARFRGIHQCNGAGKCRVDGLRQIAPSSPACRAGRRRTSPVDRQQLTPRASHTAFKARAASKNCSPATNMIGQTSSITPSSAAPTASLVGASPLPPNCKSDRRHAAF